MATIERLKGKDLRTGYRAAPQLQHRHFCFIAATVASIPDRASRLAAYLAFDTALHGTNGSYDAVRFEAAYKVEPEDMALGDLAFEIAKLELWLEGLHCEFKRRRESVHD